MHLRSGTGDLGYFSSGYSFDYFECGETDEIRHLIPPLKKMRIPIICLWGVMNQLWQKM
jgi:hypothetical protein